MGLPPFETVVVEHGARVLRVCRAVVGPAAAEDAWSETFLSALRAYPGLPDGSDLQAWLVTIAHRKAVDQVRAEARRAAPTGDLPDRAVAGGVAGGEPELPDDELWAALRALPTKQRLSVAYHHLGGLPYAEVAELVGGTAAAARRASADGLAALRARLGDRDARGR